MSHQLLTHVQNAVAETRRDDRGATMIEYGLLLGLVSVLAIPVLLVLGPRIAAMYQAVVAALP
ncbi:Flp family type IVb pilin [Kribbella sp. HUAS MG21]|uniref:Flp family type IVb pilin n=1 Tax=Kribbella sp. HUAS MG21 TaxID=3160966 RepID=A0AAU7T9V7_9ACTN